MNNPGAFCCICGYFTLICLRCNITSFVKRIYKAYFGLTLGDMARNGSHILCIINAKNCSVTGRKGNVKADRIYTPISLSSH